MYRAGLRELRLIYSAKPRWYFRTAEKALIKIMSSYIELFGVEKFMIGFSSPIFFDALAASAYLDELGGGATAVIAAILKNFIRPEMGLAVIGGKRPKGYKVPEELDRIAEIFNFDEDLVNRLKYASRMVAKVDSAAIQDGFQLYLHVMLVSMDGEWVIVQQGIKPMTNLVRRYHWISKGLRSFVEEPHSGIVSTSREELVLDMTDEDSRDARRVCVEAINHDLSSLRRFYRGPPTGQLTLTDLDGQEHSQHVIDIPRIKWSTIVMANKRSPRDFEELLALRGVGPATIRFLAAACMELYQVYPSLRDPAMLFEELPNHVDEDRWVYELIEAIQESDLTLAEKRKSLSRISGVFSTITYS